MNTKKDREMTCNGVTKTLLDWSKDLEMPINTIIMRMRRGMSEEEALSTPYTPRRSYKEVNEREVRLKKNKSERRLTDKEIEELMNSFTQGNFGRHAERNLNICKLFLNTGLRLSELCGLEVGDVLNIDGTVVDELLVREEIAKLGKPRMIPFNKKAKAAIDGLIDRSGSGFKDKVVQLSKRQVQEVVNQASLRAGLRRQVSPHDLRHTFLSLVYANTRNISAVKQLAGHASAQFTMSIYVQSTKKDLEEAVRSLD